MTDFSEYATQIINNYFSGIILIRRNMSLIFYTICSFSVDAFKVFVLSCLQNAGMLTGTFVLTFEWF